MRPRDAGRMLEVLPEPEAYNGLTAEYFGGLHEEFGAELDLLVGQSALERPYGQKRLTAAEAFYADEYQGTTSQDFMEANRTAMNLWLFDRARAGDYAAFTDCQLDAVKLTQEQFGLLQQLAEAHDPHAVRVTLMIADLGKSANVAQRMEELTGQIYADHDRLLVDVLQHPEAVTELTPSFAALDQTTQEHVLDALRTGFHLPQFMQAENLPSHLVPFQALDQEWQDFSNLVSLLDIGGAAGDTVQNGSITLNRHTFASFEQARAALAAQPEDETVAADPRQRAVYSYNAYLQSLGDHFGLDVSRPEDRALARLGRMSRANAGSGEQLAELHDVMDNYLGTGTRAILLQYLAYTGFEAGALWQEYAPALPNEALKSMTKSGVSRRDALVSALTNIARIDAETRAQMDVTATDEPVTVVIGDIVRAAEQNPRLLLNGQIKIQQTSPSEARAIMLPTEELDLAGLPAIASLDELDLPMGETMYVGYGGGADVLSSAILARLAGDDHAAVVSVWESPHGMPTHAEQLSDRVFLATPETVLPNQRHFEDIVAAMGLRSYLILQQRPFEPITDELLLIAEHAGTRRGLVGVDTGGDVLEPSSLGTDRPNRDHITLQALAEAGQQLNVTADVSCIVAPGIDSPPGAVEMLHATSARRYDMAPHAGAITGLYLAHNLPSPSPRRYSSTLPTFVRALTGFRGLEELPLPPENILRPRNPWVPYRVVQSSMSQAVFLSGAAHREALGM